MSSETSFADIGKVEAISRLYENTPFTPFEDCHFAAPDGCFVDHFGKVLLEGIDFDLEYFPLKHLGYKSVLAVTGEIYAEMSRPMTLAVTLGVSAKLDFEQVSEIWSGIVSAAREHGYSSLCLDLVPSKNGLVISLSGTGYCTRKVAELRPKARTKDLICVSGSLGAAYLGMRVLERGKHTYADGGTPDLEPYRMLVGSYLKPELGAGAVSALEDSGIIPSYGYFVTRGLSDAVLRLCRASGLGAKIYADRLPFEGNTFDLCRELDVDPISAAMNGGEDYCLLFTIPINGAEAFRRDFQAFDIIGHLALPEVGAVLVSPDGLELPLKAQGW